jgi:putative transposase
MGPAKWSYFYLYVIIDIFSRRVVGWCVADKESATLFAALFEDATTKHPTPKRQLTLHADRGGPMRAKATALLLADLGVTKSHSRPHTSNDNPFSESHFNVSVVFRTPRRSAAASLIGTIKIITMPVSA